MLAIECQMPALAMHGRVIVKWFLRIPMGANDQILTFFCLAPAEANGIVYGWQCRSQLRIRWRSRCMEAMSPLQSLPGEAEPARDMPMKRSLILSVAMLIAAVIAMVVVNKWKLHGFERTSVPGLLTERHIVNLTPVDSKHVAHGEIVLRNRGNETVKITAVSADCSCTVIGGIGQEIRPGEVVRLLASVDVIPSTSGPFEKRAAVSFQGRNSVLATEIFYLRGEVPESPKVSLLTDWIDLGCITPHGNRTTESQFYVAGPRSIIQSLPEQLLIKKIRDVTVKATGWSGSVTEASVCRPINLVVDPEGMDAAEHFHFNVNIAIDGTEKELTLSVTGRISVVYADPSSVYISSANEVKLRFRASEPRSLFAKNITSKGQISWRVLQTASENELVVAIRESASPRAAIAGVISYVDGSNRLSIPVLMLPATLSRDNGEASRSEKQESRGPL